MTPSFVQYRRIVAGVMLALCVVASALGATVKFDIPAQAAPAALQLFMQQSGTQVMFVADEIRQVTTQAVKGELEPAAALAVMLKGTGYTAVENRPGWFAVVRDEARKAASTGSVRGNLAQESGVPAVGVLVELRDSGQVARTDRNGEFFFGAVAPGTYFVVATAEGCQQLHVTDVVVRAGSELTLSMERMRPSGGAVELAPYVVKAETVERLEKFEVTDTKAKPFSDANVDRPRTINDPQAYYLFDAKTIVQSGATSVGDFLKQRLTMDATALSNSQDINTGLGNTSSINLRGLGADKTLVLVNGRRQAGVQLHENSYQADLNGLPLAAIDRIEVLPSASSGIYGGSAVGGVVNVILKKDYAGGEVRATYENTWDTDAPVRTVAANYGMTLEGGRTHLLLTAQYSDTSELLQQDRRNFFDRGIAKILQNSPSTFYSVSNPFLGATTNITKSSAGNLVLDDGTPLNVRQTFVPAGTSASSPLAQVYAGLVQNAGKYNFELPSTRQSPTGLLFPFGMAPETHAFLASVRRQMTKQLELFADLTATDNRTSFLLSPITNLHVVSAASPINPFTTAVRVRFPNTLATPYDTDSRTRSLTVGGTLQLPGEWTAEFDYARSENRFTSYFTGYDNFAVDADLASGALNPFVDTLRFPLALDKYLSPTTYRGSATLDDVSLRGAGPLPALPWGRPELTFGLEYRKAHAPANVDERIYPISTARNNRTTYFGRTQATRSGYVEAMVPLVRRDRYLFVHTLELQLSGRSEQYTVDTGTPYYAEYPNNPANSVYGEPTQGGVPYFSRTSYTSTNATAGLKYEPTRDVVVRGSVSTAFLPPTPAQLLPNAAPDFFPSTIFDPKSGGTYDVPTLSGGNPNLKPEHSRSLNAGLVWQPQGGALAGLRLDAEYFRIQQFDKIGSLGAQDVVSAETRYPGRVTRAATGEVTLVNTSYLNLTKYETEGWDLSFDYRQKMGPGTLGVRGALTIMSHDLHQDYPGTPALDYVGYVAEGGPGKYKGNFGAMWEQGSVSVGWTVRYFSSYRQLGAAGGPYSTLYADGDVYGTTVAAQGGDTIPSQAYHDLYAGYTFRRGGGNRADRPAGLGARLLDGLSVEGGVKNVFNKVPPYDAFYAYYTSPYGDKRLRSYWVSVRKQF